jgi:hypothetical protein
MRRSRIELHIKSLSEGKWQINDKIQEFHPIHPS